MRGTWGVGDVRVQAGHGALWARHDGCGRIADGFSPGPAGQAFGPLPGSRP